MHLFSVDGYVSYKSVGIMLIDLYPGCFFSIKILGKAHVYPQWSVPDANLQEREGLFRDIHIHTTILLSVVKDYIMRTNIKILRVVGGSSLSMGVWLVFSRVIRTGFSCL